MNLERNVNKQQQRNKEHNTNHDKRGYRKKPKESKVLISERYTTIICDNADVEKLEIYSLLSDNANHMTVDITHMLTIGMHNGVVYTVNTIGLHAQSLNHG